MAKTAVRLTGPSSARRPTPGRSDGVINGSEHSLAGPSQLPDPRFHAYRDDLADVALAGRVIASHYAEPLPRVVRTASALRSAPSDDAEALLELAPGETFDMLDDTLGWSWGYAGEERRVGFVRSAALTAP